LNDRVIRLIDHPNYSPRLIETVIKLWRPAEGGGFSRFFADTLDHLFCSARSETPPRFPR